MKRPSNTAPSSGNGGNGAPITGAATEDPADPTEGAQAAQAEARAQSNEHKQSRYGTIGFGWVPLHLALSF